MSVFASAGQKSKHKIERVKGVLEHLSLYVGLAIYTALGAKVGKSIVCSIKNQSTCCFADAFLNL